MEQPMYRESQYLYQGEGAVRRLDDGTASSTRRIRSMDRYSVSSVVLRLSVMNGS